MLKSKSIVIFAAVVFFGLFGLAGSSQGADYYVSPTGTATWIDCTNINTPCKASTALTNAMAGDVVYFRGGTYTPANDPVPQWVATGENDRWELPAWNPSNSGTTGTPITFKAYPGEIPILIHYQYGPVIGSNGRNYIIWDGFQGTRTSIFAFAAFRNGADHCTIQNCKIVGYDFGASGGNNMNINAHSVTYLTIKNNILSHSKGGGHNCAGILFYSVSYSTIENNEVYDCTAGIFDKDGGQYNTYRYNYIHSNSDMGFLLMTESGGPNPNNVSVYQNVLINNYAHIHFGGDKTKSNMNIYNNTMYNATTEDGIAVWEGGTNGVNVYNNIVYIAFRGPLYNDGNTDVFSNYNNFYLVTQYRLGSNTYSPLSQWQSVTNFDLDSLESNPKFVNPGGSSARDYKLQVDSPCRGKGKDGKDIGAYITGNEIIGYSDLLGSDTTPPAAPSGLQIQ